MTYTPDYAEEFEERIQRARDIANEAKSKRADPEPNVEIPVAKDMAERCEKLLEREYGSKIHGLAEQIRNLEESDEVDGREEMSLFLAEEFATGELSEDFDNDAERVEAAIRTSVAILTEGVVAAPIEGIGKVEIEPNDDGTEFIRIPYFGPIRSAGGTAQAVSVLVADYVRDLLDIAVFKPRDEEVERYVEEIYLYDGQVGMQYCPPKDKARYIVRHVPIMVDGQPNLQAVGREVDGYRDLERIEGNAPRDGMCLVMAEGIGLKAPKLQRYSEAFELSSWDWLDKLIQGSDDDDEEEDEQEDDETEEGEQEFEVPLRSDEVEVLEPSKKFMGDALAGRPIFAGASKEGGFRLRYGRGRNAGHAAVGMNPATMVLTNEFIAPSTQLKTERPGKAAGAVPVDSVEGPTVRLDTGELTRIDNVEQAREIQDHVEKIVDLGEIAIPYGEFVENNHPLAPATYAPDWWSLEFREHGGDPSEVNHDTITAEEAIEHTQETGVPLHPEYTYLWHDIEPEQYAALHALLSESKEEDGTVTLARESHKILEELLVPHKLKSDGVKLDEEIYDLLSYCVSENPVDDDVLGQVNESAPFTVRPRSLTRIGARMGRPEKAEKREMHPMVHSLFPIRDAGTDERRIDKAAKSQENADHTIGTTQKEEYKGKGVVEAEINYRECTKCDNTTFKARCPECGSRTEEKIVCNGCGNVGEEEEHGEQCRRCGETYMLSTQRELNVHKEYRDALEGLKERENNIGNVKGVKRLTSDSKIPEPIEKGLLRAKYDISTFRDGTARYDMCDLPLTTFKPQEVGISAEKARELGYKEDVNGEPLEDPDQLAEIKMQDVIVAEEAGDYLLEVSKYIDDLLVKYYDMEPFYEAETKEDLVGELMLGMAPHTSAATAARLLGFTEASANYAHPFFHAAKRRNCFHPSTELTVKLNGEWRRMRMDELVETYLEPDSDGYDDTYDDGTVVQEVAEIEVIEELKVPSITDEGRQTIENVTHLSRHEAPDHMVTIETESGDELEVTPDHKIPIKNKSGDELMKEKKAREVEQGDLLFEYDEDERDRQDVTESCDLSAVGRVSYKESNTEYTYNLTVAETHRLEAEGLYLRNCDGDEDSVMLLMDGLINFSRKYLPSQRGKNMMDAPIVMSTVIDPEEIDDEAHNVDIVENYPLEFFEMTMHSVDPDIADIGIAEDDLDEPVGFRSSLDVSDINEGPPNTAYKDVDGMQDATNMQMDLAEKTRGVDESNVASMVVEKHFFPDIIGNLTAFARQEFQCSNNHMHRRAPASGRCTARDWCDAKVRPTVYEGMVDKYVDSAMDLADDYNLDRYTQQRLEALDERIEALFEDDQSEQTSLEDFMG